MIVYIMLSRKTELSMVTAEGLPVWRLEVGRGLFARHSALRLLRNLYGSGVRRCICPDDTLRTFPEKVNITQYSSLPLRLALLDGILDILCPDGLQNAAVRLRCGGGGESAARAALPVLVRRARCICLDMPDPAPLARELLYRWGVSVGDGGRPVVLTVLCGDAPPVPPDGTVLWLTPDCACRQRVIWTSPRAARLPLAATESLAAALLEAGKWLPSDIHITSLLDIRPESHYNAT